MELSDFLKTIKTLGLKLDIVVGDGIDPMLELHKLDPTTQNDISHINRNRLSLKDEEDWRPIEHIRHYTTNARPIPSYEFIFYLVRSGIVRSIITTNYDMTLDTIFQKLSRDIRVVVKKNPILLPGEWDYNGYCSQHISAPTEVAFWKIHGSLSHFYCRGCKTLLKSPDFVVPFGAANITDRYNHPITHSYLPGNTSCCPISVAPSSISGSICGHYVHAIDWKVPDLQITHPFKKIITSTIDSLHDNAKAIIFLGFKGNKIYEEINTEIERLSGTGLHLFMILSESQKDKVESAEVHHHLRDLVLANSGQFMYLNPPDMACYLMSELCSSGLVDINDLLTFESMFEAGYVPVEYWERSTVY